MRWIKILFVLILAISAFKFATLVINAPAGGWDAWAIWNLKARFLLAGSPNIFAPEISYSHFDYPLLIPALVALSWRITGTTSQLIPMIWTTIFTWTTVALFYATVRRLQSAYIAQLWTVLLLVSTHFIVMGTTQAADTPIILSNLATIVGLVMYGKSKRYGWLAFAGTCAGMGLNVKNEGALFLVCAVVAYSLPLLRARRGLLIFAIALLPWVVAYFYFKLTIAPPNDIINTGTNLSKLLSLERHRMILDYLVPQLGILLLGLFSALCIIRLYMPFSLKPVRPLAVFLLMLAGFYGIYLLTPLDLEYHLDSSLSRLLIQVFPIALAGAALSINPSEPAPAQS